MKAVFANSPDLAKGYSLKVDADGLKNLLDLMVAAGQIEAPSTGPPSWMSSTCPKTPRRRSDRHRPRHTDPER